MSKKYLNAALLIIGFLSFPFMAQDNANFFFAENGVTCLCPEAEVGDTGTLTIDGEVIIFTKRTEAELRSLVNIDENNLEIALTCTSGVTNMSGLFQNKPEFNQDIRSWDVSQVTSMSNMFFSASQFNQPLNDWDVSQVTTMQGMFEFAVIFDQPLNDWDVSQVTTMFAMFNFAESFDQPLSDWEVSQVTNMRGIFSNAIQFNKPLNDWDVSQVTNMSFMFSWTESFEQPLNDWDVSQVTNMDRMFESATNFNQNLSGWCVEQIQAEPSSFDLFADAWTLPNSRPVWGTCPNLSIEAPNELSLVLYPNPTSSKVYVDNPSYLKLKSILVYNMTGRIVKSRNISTDSQVIIDISDLSSGSYIVEVSTSEGQKLTQRLLVN